jgi:hypothetical protein
MTDEPKPRLRPARPPSADHDSASYMPRLPWRWIALGTLSVLTVMGGYWFKEQRKADQLRSQILRVHDAELAEPSRRYQEFRGKLERFILEAGTGKPKPFVDRRLRITGLRSGRGLYLRLPAKQARDKKNIEEGALAMAGDAIPSCLGLAPSSARGIWEKGGFLMPEWIDAARDESGVMDLRVIDDMLARRISADLPGVLNLIRAHWFLLVIEQGDNRRDHPVDVFLWDLKSEQKLLSARIQAAGVLMPVRIRSKDAPPTPGLPPERLAGGGATDCSIAAQLKQLAGTPLAEVQNVPSPAASDDAGVDAALE